MENSNKLFTELDNLSPLLKEYVLGTNGKIQSLSTNDLIETGDNLINFISLLYLNYNFEKYELNKKKIELSIYFKNLLGDNRGTELGLSICIINEIMRKNIGLPTKLTPKKISETLSKWVSLRKLINSIKSYKIISRKYRPEIASTLYEIVSNFVCNEIELTEENSLIYCSQSIKHFPFILLSGCSSCVEKHLFAFDNYSSSNDEYIYRCNGKLHHKIIDSNDQQLKKRLDIFKEQFITKTKNVNAQPSYLPLFASSYPSMEKLVELLFTETQEYTKNDLWLSKLSNEEALKCKTYPELIKNYILIDCIESDPIQVISKVAREEGTKELPGYVEVLLHNVGKKKSEIEKEIDNIENECKRIIKEKNETNELEKKNIRDEVYAIKVAGLLGFQVKNINNMHNIEYVSEKINQKLDIIRSKENINTRDELNVLFPYLESIYEELVIFYNYIYLKYIMRSFDENDWYTFLSAKLTFGKKNEKLRELNQEFQKHGNQSVKYIGKDQIFNPRKYSTLIKEGDKFGDIFGLRNAATHFDPNKYLRDCDDRNQCIKLLIWIKEIVDFFSNSKDRIFPYKITFTVLSETHHGIKTCQYITDLSELGLYKDKTNKKVERTKIYTEIPINFTKYYYCLPNRRRSTETVWVDPLLIPIDDVISNTEKNI